MATVGTLSVAGGLVPMRRIRKLANEIAAKFHPRKIILFGSYARGEATPDSDVDLMVIVDRKPSSDMAINISRQVDYDFGLDLLIVDMKRLETHLAEGDFFLEEVVHGGKVLYEKRDR